MMIVPVICCTEWRMDAVAPRLDQPLAPWNRWIVAQLNDPRDLPFVHLMVQCLLVAACGVALYFVPHPYFFPAVVAYWLLWGFGVVDRYILMLHCTSHRILFKREMKALNHVIPWVIGPFMGEPPEGYFIHHLGMHHPENNMHNDLSSTLRFRRDRFRHWLRYLGRFMTLVWIELPQYHFRKGRVRMAARSLFAEIGFWVVVGLLCLLNWQATLAVFVIPVLVVRLLMMAGNWGQHAFVDSNDPENPYRNSITCINTRYNRRCFNDGYHIHHHVKARCHWSEYPEEFETNKRVYGQQDAIVFDGIDFFQVWLLLMTKRFNTLAKHFVRLPEAPARSDEEVIAFLQSRLHPIPASSGA